MSVEEPRRMQWTALPATIRDQVEALLGSPVILALSQPGGFSSGSADRVCTSAGRSAFVKAISSTMNAGVAGLHRREAQIAAALPQNVAAPRLLGAHDDGEWIALVFEDVAGRHPGEPWHERELILVLDALARLAKQLTPSPALDAPTAGSALAHAFAGWDRIAAYPPGDLDPWAQARLPLLRELAAGGLAALDGDTLVHYDVRADNLLLTADGRVVLLDWPWACRGPAWLDTLMLLITVNLHGGHDVDALVHRGATAKADPQQVTAVLAGQAGYTLDAARLPPPVGMPELRAFQHAKGSATLGWLRRRLDG